MLKSCHKLYTEQELKTFSTHTLIKKLRDITELYYYDKAENKCTICKDYKKCWEKFKEEKILNEIRIRKELATRPHIPDKKQSKKIRQDRAKYKYRSKSIR